MKRVVLLVTTCVTLLVLMLCWRAPDKPQDDFYRPIEVNLSEALQRLREASGVDRRANASLVSGVMILADALAQSNDARQKRLAADAEKEVGQILFNNGQPTNATTDDAATASGRTSSTSDLSQHVEPFPGPLPEQLFTPLPLQSYVGTYAGIIAGRQVKFLATITSRNLLGIRIVGLDVQPVLEFAEFQPQKFIRPDARTLIFFTDRTDRGFGTLVFQQNGTSEEARNILFTVSDRK